MTFPPVALFALICGIWGTTWLAIAAGVAVLPPFLFAGSRFLTAGLILLAARRLLGRPVAPPRGEAPAGARGGLGRLVAVAALAVIGAYGFMFWGAARLPSGTVALVNFPLTALALYGFGMAYGSERLTARAGLALALGLAGLAVLFRSGASAAHLDVAGLGAVMAGTLFYCWGSVHGRPLLRRHEPGLVAGWTLSLGGAGLLVLSALFEPLAQLPLAALLDPAAVAGWLFLVIAGSLVAFTLYLRLLRDWGPLRTGLYAFVTPLIAVALGVLVQGERFGAGDAAGGLLMLAATWLCLTGTAPSAGQPADHRPGLADQGRDQVGRGQRPGQRRRLAGP